MECARMEWKTIFHTSYQFHTRFRALYLQKHIYGCQVVTINIVTEVFYFNIYGYYLSTNRGSLVVHIHCANGVLHRSKYRHCNLQH